MRACVPRCGLGRPAVRWGRQAWWLGRDCGGTRVSPAASSLRSPSPHLLPSPLRPPAREGRGRARAPQPREGSQAQSSVRGSPTLLASRGPGPDPQDGLRKHSSWSAAVTQRAHPVSPPARSPSRAFRCPPTSPRNTHSGTPSLQAALQLTPPHEASSPPRETGDTRPPQQARETWGRPGDAQGLGRATVEWAPRLPLPGLCWCHRVPGHPAHPPLSPQPTRQLL